MPLSFDDLPDDTPSAIPAAPAPAPKPVTAAGKGTLSFDDIPSGAKPGVSFDDIPVDRQVPLSQQDDYDPFANESNSDTLKRRGQQAAQSATEAFSQVPKTYEIKRRQNIAGVGDTAAGTLDAHAAELDALNSKLAEVQAGAGRGDPDAKDQVDVINARIAELKNQDVGNQKELDTAEVTARTPIKDSPGFKIADYMNDAEIKALGAPDPRDNGFWANAAKATGGAAGMVGATVVGSAALGPEFGVALGAGMGAADAQASIYDEAIKAGADEKTATKASDFGAAIGAAGAIPIARALQLLPPTLRAKVGNAFFQKVVSVGQSAGEQGVVGYLSQVANNLVAKNYYDPERNWNTGATESGIMQALVGGGISAVHGAVSGHGEGQEKTKVDMLPENGPSTEQDVALKSNTPPTTTTRQIMEDIATKVQPGAKGAEAIAISKSKEAPPATPPVEPAPKAAAPEPAKPETAPSEPAPAAEPVPDLTKVSPEDDPAKPTPQGKPAEPAPAPAPAEQTEPAPEPKAAETPAEAVPAPTEDTVTKDPEKRFAREDFAKLKPIDAVRRAGAELGVDPKDIAIAISYETGGRFDPGLRGGKNGLYEGLIQFGPAEQKKYGIHEGMTFSEQMGAVTDFLRDRGVKPGMGLLDIYSTINAGSPGHYNASDGQFGTVRDKVESMMSSGHVDNAERFLGGKNFVGVGRTVGASRHTPKDLTPDWYDSRNRASGLENGDIVREPNDEQTFKVNSYVGADGKKSVILEPTSPDGEKLYLLSNGLDGRNLKDFNGDMQIEKAPKLDTRVETQTDPNALNGKVTPEGNQAAPTSEPIPDVSTSGGSSEPRAPRILNDQSPESQAARRQFRDAADRKIADVVGGSSDERRDQRMQQVKDDIANNKFSTAGEEAVARAKAGGANPSKEHIEGISARADAAKESFDHNIPDDIQPVKDLQDRRGFAKMLNKSVDEMTRKLDEKAPKDAPEKTKSYWRIPEKYATFDTNTDHVVWATHARSLARRILANKSGNAEMNDHVNKFIADTRALKAGNGDMLRQRRLEEGNQARSQKGAGGVDHLAAPADGAKSAPEETPEITAEGNGAKSAPDKTGEDTAEPSRAGETAVNKEDVETKVSKSASKPIKTFDEEKAKTAAPVKKVSFKDLSPEEQERIQKLAQAHTGSAAKESGAGSEINAKKLNDLEINPGAKTLAGAVAHASGTVGEYADRMREITFAKVLAGNSPLFSDVGRAIQRKVAPFLLKELRKMTADVPVHILTDDAYRAIEPPNLKGRSLAYYDAPNDQIVIHGSVMRDPQAVVHILTHEAAHAAFWHNIQSERMMPRLEKLLDFAKHQYAAIGGNVDSVYGFSNIHEFVSEAWSNPDFQGILAKMRIRPDYWEALGVKPTFVGRLATMWDYMKFQVASSLGIIKSMGSDSSVFNHAMDISQRLIGMGDMGRKWYYGKDGPVQNPEKFRVVEDTSPGRTLPMMRDYADDLRAAGVPHEHAEEAGQWLKENVGKTVDPLTVPQMMQEFASRFQETPKTEAGGASPPSGTVTPKGKTPASDGSPTKPEIKNTSSALRRAALRVTTTDFIRQKYGHLFPDKSLDRYVEAVQKRENYVNEAAEPHDRNAAEFIDAMKKNKADAVEMAELAMEASRLNLNLGADADNTHLGTDAWRGEQAKYHMNDLQARYDALQAKNPDMIDLMHQLTDTYRDSHNEGVQGLTYNILSELKPKLSNGDVMDLMKRTNEGRLTEDDEKLVNNPTIFKALQNANELRTLKGIYFPQMRFGDHVVVTTDHVEHPGITEVTLKGKGTKVPVTTKVEGNVVRFAVDDSIRGAGTATKRAAREYMASHDMHATDFRVRYEDKVSGKIMPESETDPTRDYNKVFEVELQNKGVHFFESAKEAEKFRKTNPADEFSDVLQRRNDPQGRLIAGSALSAVVHSIETRTDIPEGRRAQLRNLLHDAITSQMEGNKASSRYKARRNVQGASDDIGRAALTYGRAHGNRMATIYTGPEQRQALTDMQAHASKAQMERGVGGVVSEITNEMTRRDARITGPDKSNQIAKDISTLSYFDKLVSPAASVINAQQVINNSLPHLGGRYGNIRATAAIASAYKRVGAFSTLAKGIGNMGNAVTHWGSTALNTTNIGASIRERLGKKYEPLLDQLTERGILSGDSSLEIGAATEQGRGTWGKGLSKFDRIARQVPNAIEAVNRTVTAVATYDLATSKGKSHQEAIKEAIDSTITTQGDYRKSNSPMFMRDNKLAWAMQFKKYALMQTQLAGDMVHRAFKADTKQERYIAAKQFATFCAVQSIYAGALGMPGMELVKIATNLAGLLGVGDGWDEDERRIRAAITAGAGKTWGEIINNGALSSLFGVDLSSRMSQADLWTGFSPKTLDTPGMMAYAGQAIMGAPGSTLLDWAQAAREFGSGNFEKSLELAVPIKMVADTTKAVRGYQQGTYTAGDVVKQSIGFKPMRQARAAQITGDKIAVSGLKKQNEKDLANSYMNSTTIAERVRAISKIRQYNATLQKGARAINLKQLEKYRLEKFDPKLYE